MKRTKTLTGVLVLFLAVSLAACGRPASQETDTFVIYALPVFDRMMGEDDDTADTSADQTIALTRYLLNAYNIDTDQVYANGYSEGRNLYYQQILCGLDTGKGDHDPEAPGVGEMLPANYKVHDCTIKSAVSSCITADFSFCQDSGKYILLDL